MDEEKANEDADREFKAKVEDLRNKDAAKTEKNRLKREKARLRKGKKGAADAEPVVKDALIIAVSGYGQEQDRARSREAG